MTSTVTIGHVAYTLLDRLGCDCDRVKGVTACGQAAECLLSLAYMRVIKVYNCTARSLGITI